MSVLRSRIIVVLPVIATKTGNMAVQFFWSEVTALPAAGGAALAGLDCCDVAGLGRGGAVLPTVELPGWSTVMRDWAAVRLPVTEQVCVSHQM